MYRKRVGVLRMTVHYLPNCGDSVNNPRHFSKIKLICIYLNKYFKQSEPVIKIVAILEEEE